MNNSDLGVAEFTEKTVAVPVALLRSLEKNWESGDLAGAVTEVLAYLPDEPEPDAPASIRFTCPADLGHTEFYLRRSYSEAYRVNARGVVADEPTRNSYEGEGSGAVLCSNCADLGKYDVEAVDVTQGEDLLTEDEAGPI